VQILVQRFFSRKNTLPISASGFVFLVRGYVKPVHEFLEHFFQGRNMAENTEFV